MNGVLEWVLGTPSFFFKEILLAWAELRIYSGNKGSDVSDQGSMWGLVSKWFEILWGGGHTKELKDPCCLRAQVLA